MNRWSDLRRLLWPALAVIVALAIATGNGTLLGWVGLADRREAFEPVAGSLVYFSVAWLAARLIGFALDRAARRRRQVPRLLKELVAVALFAAALVASIMLFLGQSMAGALAGSGILLAVIGFAIRNVVADTLSGIALGLEGPFRIGDWVDIDGMGSGKVIEIGWRTTRILTRDSTYMVLPNSQIARQKLTNFSAPRRNFRARIEVVLSYELPIAEARDLLREAAAGAQTVQQDPAPDVRVLRQDGEGIHYAVRYWVRRYDDEIDCRDELHGLIDAALRARDVPPPRRELRIVKDDLATWAIPSREAGIERADRIPLSGE
ncbi:mechanosensitive ion channel family protein [Roseovarius sp. SCSIO 43702]|uniref:mechanosensitive ion channel family protein n=1 Tax=Roseovarius sp. SCSIO 43702 TaxID=2823043 RepID=UPI001C730B01|nr:mechanosensitive ion channel family protein [Roseovarius sp. SCSIO 43702]QYX58207.1 mechanosensitive ion channel family protein [Roseovarius sp. SCSIO 43702]